MSTGFLISEIIKTKRIVTFSVCVVALFSLVHGASAQGPIPGSGGGGLAASGGATAERLVSGKAAKNTYRFDRATGQGGVSERE